MPKVSRKEVAVENGLVRLWVVGKKWSLGRGKKLCISLQRQMILESQYVQVSLIQSLGALPTEGSRNPSVSPSLMPEAALFSIYKSCWGEPGEQTLHTPPGRGLAHRSICVGAMPAFLLTTNPSSASPGERLSSLLESLGR